MENMSLTASSPPVDDIPTYRTLLTNTYNLIHSPAAETVWDHGCPCRDGAVLPAIPTTAVVGPMEGR